MQRQLRNSKQAINLVRASTLLLLILFLSGCASTGQVQNQPLERLPQGPSRVVDSFSKILSNAEQGVMLAFSGGGTRAAALAYGVLQELEVTKVGPEHDKRALLDDVGLISSVSGGSFTAAYYGLHGRKIFTDFETAFLRKNVESALVKNLLNPLHWVGSLDRTEYAIRYYDKEVFKDATFADLHRADTPLVLINATDLAHGVRFSFMQEYFNLLCSDLSSFPISRAVTASSAVPILFDPVVMKNHDGCQDRLPRWLQRARARGRDNPELMLTVTGLESYFDREKHQFAHFVDGGITDNLGLRAIYDMTQLTGDGRSFLAAMKVEPASRLVVISVDASTQPEYQIGASGRSPDLFSTIKAMTDIQLHRYNTATVSEMHRSLNTWAEQISTPDTQVEVFFVRLNFDSLSDSDQRTYINQIPTSFNLSDEQVDAVVLAGRQLLRENPEFQRLLATIELESARKIP